MVSKCDDDDLMTKYIYNIKYSSLFILYFIPKSKFKYNDDDEHDDD